MEKEIKTTDFGIAEEESEALFPDGREGAKKFLSRWDFEEWKRKCGQ
jgi:hypothetical protein